MTDKRISRRQFLSCMAVGSGVLSLAAAHSGTLSAEWGVNKPVEERLPREIWIATLSQHRIRTRTSEEMVERMYQEMQKVVPYQPDIICLPELFSCSNIDTKPAVPELAESPPGPITGKFAEFAQENGCYIICPTITEENGIRYNAAVVIDRAGEIMGEYRKTHPTITEMEWGVTPGPKGPPVFTTDFGTIGIQICFDIQWDDGWKSLQESGAEIVFWPSAFAGGAMVNAQAWKHNYCLVSSTNKDDSKICDITGQEIASTGRWNPQFACAPVNLEKAFLHTWPYVRRFPEIQAKYGRKVQITNFHEEEWSIIESRSADVQVTDILEEFGLKTMQEHLRTAEIAQTKHRS